MGRETNDLEVTAELVHHCWSVSCSPWRPNAKKYQGLLSQNDMGVWVLAGSPGRARRMSVLMSQLVPFHFPTYGRNIWKQLPSLSEAVI